MGRGLCWGPALGEELGVSPGSAAASLWVREFGDGSSFSRDAHRRRVHLAVCNFVGLGMGHLLASATPGRVPGSPAEHVCWCGRGQDATRLPAPNAYIPSYGHTDACWAPCRAPRVPWLAIEGSEQLAVSMYRKVRVCSVWEMSHFLCVCKVLS